MSINEVIYVITRGWNYEITEDERYLIVFNKSKQFRSERILLEEYLEYMMPDDLDFDSDETSDCSDSDSESDSCSDSASESASSSSRDSYSTVSDDDIELVSIIIKYH